MAADEAWSKVKKSQYDSLRQQREHCPDFRKRLQDLPEGGPSKRRKTLQYSASKRALQQLDWSQQPEPQSISQVSQGLGPRLSPSSKAFKWKTAKRPPAKGARLRAQQKPRRIEAVEWFLGNAPRPSEWRKRQRELGLNTVEQYEEIIRAFTDRTAINIKRKPYQGGVRGEHELLDLAERFALLTQAPLTDAKCQRSFATFQALILLSFCEVLKKRDVSNENIHRTIEYIAGERDRRRLLNSARWINGLIFDLVGHGWTIYRATELFFINALSLTNLINIRNDENLNSILNRFTEDEFVKHDYSDCLGPEFTIPSLIASLLDTCRVPANRISIDEIYTALGYGSDRVPKSLQNTYNVQAACQSTSTAPIDFDILVPSSFHGNERPFDSSSNAYSAGRIAPTERRIPEYLSSPEHSTNDPRCLATGYQEISSFASAPGDHSKNPLLDTPPNTLNIVQGAQSSESIRICSAGTSHNVESSCTSPMSTAVLVPAFHQPVSWDERFLLLERISPDAAKILEFLCTLQPDEIPEILFCRMWTTRECWSSDGDIERVNIPINAPLIDLMMLSSRFYENTRLLESFGFIKSEPGPLGKRKFSIKPDFQDRMTGITRNLDEVQWLRLVLVCHSFPGRLEEIGFGDTGRALLPQVRHAFTNCQGLCERILANPLSGHGILLTLLLSSKLHGREWKYRAVALAEEILPNRPPFEPGTLYLRMFAKQRSRDLSRRIPNSPVESIDEELLPIDPRTNALYGEHLRSNAQDRIMDGSGDLDGALEELRRFEFFHDVPTTMEDQEKDHHLFIEGKTYRWKASFSEASDIFYRLLGSTPSLSNERGCNLTGHYIATLCEQRRLTCAERSARQAIASCKDFDEQGLKRQGLKMFRSLQLSLAETLICRILVEILDGRNDTEKVDQCLMESELMFEEMKKECELVKGRKEGTWGLELDYLRVNIGRALVSHLANRVTEAYGRWQDTRKSAEVCKNKVTRFIPMIVDYCECDINIKLGRWQGAEELRKRARSCFSEVGREHWWTGLGTFLLDWLKDRIPESGIDVEQEIVLNWI